MKNLKALSVVLMLFSAISFTSCDTEPLDPALSGNDGNNGGNNGGNNDSAIFRADIDGQTFTASTTQAIVTTDYISITAMKTDGSFFQITIPAAQEGTYVWLDTESPGNVMALAYSPGSGNVPYLGVSDDYGTFADYENYTDTAEIIVTDIDTQNNTISGTFKFTGVRFVDPAVNTDIETIEVTNGEFTNLTYSTDVEALPQQFFAKLNGQNFSPTSVLVTEMGNNISISGRRGSVENIGLVFPSDIEPGEYEFSFLGDYHGLYVMNMSPEGSFGAESGTLTIISHDTTNKKVKGTFSFTASQFGMGDSHEITEGTFNVSY